MNRHVLKVPLPHNETPRENTFAKLADRLFEIENPTRALFDPYTCPVEFLPYLAWARSVDVWDDEWDEQVKRRVIAAAPEVHRYKGTRFAVETALNAIGHEYELIEWWEAEPVMQHGTFAVTVFHDRSDDLSPKRQVQIHDSIRYSKPKSRTFSLIHLLRARAAGKLYTAAFPSTRLVATALPFFLDPPVVSGPLRCAVAPLSRLIVTAHAAA